jgi:hypothetical protein
MYQSAKQGGSGLISLLNLIHALIMRAVAQSVGLPGARSWSMINSWFVQSLHAYARFHQLVLD